MIGPRFTGPSAGSTSRQRFVTASREITSIAWAPGVLLERRERIGFLLFSLPSRLVIGNDDESAEEILFVGPLLACAS